MGDSTFERCAVLEKVDFGDGLQTIGDAAFQYCPFLSEITVPEGVTAMGTGVFKDCERLQEVNLPSTLKSMGGSYPGDVFEMSSVLGGRLHRATSRRWNPP